MLDLRMRGISMFEPTNEQKKQDFIRIITENIKRDGVENLMAYLEESGFYTSPASTKYHGSYEGGLLDHSLNVYYALLDEMNFIYGKNWRKKWSDESVAIVALFHDLCKIGRYKSVWKNVKNKETGVWEEKKCYEYDSSKFCMGHAALSLQIINRYMILTDEEAQAIYWHMGPYDLSEYSNKQELGFAYNRNTLSFALNRADMFSTYVIENPDFKYILDNDQFDEAEVTKTNE